MEDKESMKVPEPVGGALQEYPIAEAESEIDFDFGGKDFDYARTLEELELALDEANAERNDPSKWISPVEMHTRLESKYEEFQAHSLL